MWADVFEAHHAAFFTYALHLEGNVHDAEDLVQMLLLRLASRDRPHEDAFAYAMAAMRNLALDQRRRRLVQERRNRSASNTLFLAAHSDHDVIIAGSEAANEEEAARLRYALDQLDDSRREIIILKVFSDLSLRQIAAVLNQPLGTVASAYRRALIEIRTRLERECQCHE